MAVVMALAVILIMSTAALELHVNERSNLLNAAAMRDRLTLNQMATSGIHMAMAVLVKDRLDSTADSLQEDWADDETMQGFLEQIPFERGELRLEIIDELSKIQINALVQFPEGGQFNAKQRSMWERFAGDIAAGYELLAEAGEGLEEIEPLTIINSIKDWIDKDEDIITGLNGAESDYYEELDPPYACRNAPFDHLSAVRLVRGITPELFDGYGGTFGLGHYITVYGDVEADSGKLHFPGHININTAELPVLNVLLPSESEEFAELLIEHRQALSGTRFTHDLTDKNWYKGVPGFADITIDPDLFSVSSHVFRIVSTAELETTRTTITAVVSRERSSESAPWRCKILNWMTE
jgi:general secretion pathway protein K